MSHYSKDEAPRDPNMEGARVDERGRWISAARQLEFDRTINLLGQRLAPRSRILDLGGGRGQYTIALARRGHRMTLVDFEEKSIHLARRELNEHDLLKRVDELSQANLCDLPLGDDAGFDAVIAFEPFLDLLDPDARAQVAGEAVRVTRDEGLIFVHFMPPPAGFIGLLHFATHYPGLLTEETVEKTLDTHIFEPPPPTENEPEPSRLQPPRRARYFSEIEEITALFEDHGVQTLDALSLTGVATGREAQFLQMGDDNPRLHEICRDLLEQTCRIPEIIATGNTAAWVGQKQTRH